MSSLLDVANFVKDLQIVSTGDGFDVTLTDRQVDSLKSSIRRAINSPSSGKRSPVRVTNMRRVLLPVAAEMAWPYLVGIIGAGFLAGLIIGKQR